MDNRRPFDSVIPENPLTLGERLRWLRKMRGLTQVELAEALSCDQTVISSWEVGRAQPTAATLAALARFHGVTVENLEEGRNFLKAAEKALHDTRSMGTGASRPQGPVSVELEAPPAGKVHLVDLPLASVSPKEASDAMNLLLKAVKKGRDVWIVLR